MIGLQEHVTVGHVMKELRSNYHYSEYVLVLHVRPKLFRVVHHECTDSQQTVYTV